MSYFFPVLLIAGMAVVFSIVFFLKLYREKKTPAGKKSILRLVLLSFAGVSGVLLLLAGVIAGVLALNFDRFFRHAYEEDTKGMLGSLRGEITIYCDDTNGKYPSLEYFYSDKFKTYMKVIPKEKIKRSNKIVNKFDGTGGWYYCDDPNSAEYGKMFLNLDGKDVAGKAYREY